MLQSENDKRTQEKEPLLIKTSQQYHIEQNYIYDEQQSQPSQQNKNIKDAKIVTIKNQKQKEQKNAAEK